MKTSESTPEPRTNPTHSRYAPRRQWLATVLALPLLTLAWSLGACRSAFAADTPVPPTVSALDSAAMAMFDAGETRDWAAASAALVRAKNAARDVAQLQTIYVTSGGTLEHFFEVQNNLRSDLMEADTATSVQDQRWLVRAADHLVTRAGELSEPFKPRHNSILPRVETLLFLARRMRRARVSQDANDYADASATFGQLWSALRHDLPASAASQATALEQALSGMGASSTSADIRKFYLAVATLRDAVS
ncbi:MAG: hypothetical protein ABIR55_04225 [Burkholderiaceae bacterium]